MTTTAAETRRLSLASLTSGIGRCCGSERQTLMMSVRQQPARPGDVGPSAGDDQTHGHVDVDVALHGPPSPGGSNDRGEARLHMRNFTLCRLYCSFLLSLNVTVVLRASQWNI